MVVLAGYVGIANIRVCSLSENVRLDAWVKCADSESGLRFQSSSASSSMVTAWEGATDVRYDGMRMIVWESRSEWEKRR